MIPRVVIAGVQSGVGKTTVATGLMAALAKKGYRVQGFKVGPDYIDPGYHTVATGNISRNLDSWMLTAPAIRELFFRAAKDADIAVIEGVMGLYDGAGAGWQAGSTAQVAKYLRAPVILVVNAKGMARSAAAMVLGYKQFDPEVYFGGVIFNNVGGEKHFRILKEAVEGAVGLKALGYLEKNAALKTPERHLGLVPTAEKSALASYLDRLAGALESSVNLEEILAVARSAPPLDCPGDSIFPDGQKKEVKIAVARDAAFNFYYQDALDLLAEHGAELVYFSPLRDRTLPEGVHGIYIGGGFPEMFLEPLAANRTMIAGIVSAHRRGMPVYAECGGLMYLSEGIVDFSGNYYPLAGLVPGRACMQEKLAALGYMTAEVLTDNILARKGDILRGHQFRWSVLADVPPDACYAYKLAGADGAPALTEEGFVRGNLLASYLHLHFAAHPQLARNFVESCRRYKRWEVGSWKWEQKGVTDEECRPLRKV